jgi:hypothetical protein
MNDVIKGSFFLLDTFALQSSGFFLRRRREKDHCANAQTPGVQVRVQLQKRLERNAEPMRDGSESISRPNLVFAPDGIFPVRYFGQFDFEFLRFSLRQSKDVPRTGRCYPSEKFRV